MVFTQNVSHEWHHAIGEIVTALLDAGLALTGLVEHDSVPWNAFPGKMEQIAGNEWRLADRPARLAHSFTIQAVRAPRQGSPGGPGRWCPAGRGGDSRGG